MQTDVECREQSQGGKASGIIFTFELEKQPFLLSGIDIFVEPTRVPTEIFFYIYM